MKLTILDANSANPGDLSWDKFRELAEVTLFERTNQEEVVNRVGDSDAIFVNKVCITDEILQKLPNLKYIGVCATGYNVIDIEGCKKRNVTVTNIPAYSTDAVAQHVFALINHFTNSVALHNTSVHNGDWIKSPDFSYWKQPLFELSGKTLGIFGYGNIGSKVAKIGEAYGMKVICNTRTQKPGMPEFVSFERLLRESDIISLHAPLTEQTKEIINTTTLSMMKPTSYLINTARGGFIVEEDLAECLKKGGIAGYAADVVLTEPMLPNHPFLNCPNCVITPHIGWAPRETRQRLIGIAYDNLKAYIDGKPINVVSK